MAKKYFETDDSIQEQVKAMFASMGLAEVGIKLQIISTTKQKDVVRIAKTSEPTEFLTETDNAIQVFIYEGVFLELDSATQDFLLEFAFTPVWFDSDKNKVMIEKNPYQPLFNLRLKYGERADEMLEASYLAIKQYEEGNNE